MDDDDDDDDDDDYNMDELWPITGGRNYMRYKANDPEVIELLVQSRTHGDKIFLFDAWRLDDVKDHRWCAQKHPSGFYAVTNWNIAGRKRTKKAMHVLLFPDLGRQRDHINRNTQDNREANLRCGDHGVNARNRKMHSTNSSGAKGVYRVDGAWKAFYRKRGGKRIESLFYAHNCGDSDAEALRQAIHWQEAEADKAMEDCITNGGDPIPHNNGKRKRHQKQRNNTTNIPGVSHDTARKRYRAVWQENRKSKSKTFPYGRSGDPEAAKEAARQYREEMIRGKYDDHDN